MDANPSNDETSPSRDEVIEAVATFRGEKAADTFNISAELLKDGAATVIHWLNVVMAAVWQSGTIPLD